MSDLTVSFVLYRTPLTEVETAIAQVRSSHPEARIVLVDNSPIPNPLPLLHDRSIHVIRPGANVGYGSGHNLAFALSADSKYHAVLNTDLSFGQEAFPKLISFMERHPDAGLVMPRVCYPDGSIQYLCRLLPSPLDVFGRGFFSASRWVATRNDRYEFRTWNYASIADFPFLSGCFMLLRRSVIDEVGGFDERFFMYGEDVDLSRRIHARYRTVFFPDVTIVHEYRSLSKGWRNKFLKVANLSRYFNKWGWFFDKERKAINKRVLMLTNVSRASSVD